METASQVLNRLKPRMRPYYNRIRYTETYKKLNLKWLTHARPLIWSYHARSIGELVRQDIFGDVKTFCMFLGHPRSGHTLIGSLLDAHPRIVLSDELDALKYLEAGFTKNQIFHLILEKSRSLAGRKKSGRNGKSHLYTVPGQWQGRYETIRVIGDKRGGTTTARLGARPELLQDIRRTIDTTIKWIVVVRNPYDNISTMFLRDYKNRNLKALIENYFASCRKICNIRRFIADSDIVFLRHEDFIENAGDCLDSLCRFLGVETSSDYLNACAAIVYKSPVKSRHEIEWNPDLIRFAAHEIETFEFLSGYSYEV
jgi:hypothetical protein